MAYVAPTWVNGGPPALDAAALNAISQALARLPMENGGTFATSGAAGLYNLINATATLTSGTLASGDYVGVQDVSAGTGKRTTLSNLASWIGSNGTGAKIATGSYTGTGTYGASNPNSITFPFTPKLVWIPFCEITGYGIYPIGATDIYSNNSTDIRFNVNAISISSLSTSYKNIGMFDKYNNVYSKYSGNTLSWYNATNAEGQLNLKQGNYSYVYHWIAFG